MSPWKFKELQDEQEAVIEKAEERIARACDRVKMPAAKLLRPATAADIVEGNVIIYPPQPDGCGDHWQIVAEVRYPNDDFKAYVAENGCRFGLRGAYVRRESE